jgi:hypothetical protein
MTVKKSYLIYAAIFLAGVWAAPKVAPTLRKIPVAGGVF